MPSTLNQQVRQYWEQEPCGTSAQIAGTSQPLSREWFERIEQHRYCAEPMIREVAQFESHRGERILEVGVGAGTDHLQWARAGCECYGVDLTQAAIDTVRSRLALYGFESNLQRLDAEKLPFDDARFDLVYSWGVIHHSEHPDAIVAEIVRVLRPGGKFIGMVYGRRSLLVAKMWLRHALLAGKPWRTPADVVWHHMESVGTKAYTVREVRQLLRGFSCVTIRRWCTVYDTARLPDWLAKHVPNRVGWFITFEATR